MLLAPSARMRWEACRGKFAAVSPYVIVSHTGEFTKKRTEWSDARKTDLWHGPGLLSLVSHCYAPHSQVAGQRPRRPCRHRQPRALGLGGDRRYTAGGEPAGRSRGPVERQPAELSRHRRLRQSRGW